MKQLALGTAKHLLKAFLYGIAGGAVMLLAVAVHKLNSRPDLHIWHEVELENEFTTSSKVSSFAEYLALEDTLFAELDEKVYDRIGPEDKRHLNRYHRGSMADPGRWPRNWNRTFELSMPDPSAGVLLLHGMSDGPYSLRSLGETLHARGAWAVGLRIPGHGTAPSGLVEVTWEDMDAAVRLAMRHLNEKVGGKPVIIVGYSNGAALAVEYALACLDEDTLPKPDKLVLVSPSIGVSPAAALAVWQGRLGWLLGLKKLAWNAVLPEYDPFNYNSFAVNAGHQVHCLTTEIRDRLGRLGGAGKLESFPPTLAFQSVVDATVSTPALLEVLFNRLPNPGNELVLFDINRNIEVEPLLRNDPTARVHEILSGGDFSYTLRLLTNETAKSGRVAIRTYVPGQPGFTESDTDLEWPSDVYSLSHVSPPFPEDDPLYGRVAPAREKDRLIHLGDVALRGERGILQVSAAAMLRLRWNPFYPYLEKRTLEFLGFSGD